MVCRNCNNQNPNGTTRCMYCGRELRYSASSNNNNNQFKYLPLSLIIMVLFAGSFYVGYSSSLVHGETEMVRVAYAKRDINRFEEVTEDIIGYREVPASSLNDLFLLTDEDFKYNDGICANDLIVKDSYFTYELLHYCDEYLEEGMHFFELKLSDNNILNSYALNKYVDIYVKINDPDSLDTYYGEALDFVKVLDVLNDNGKSILSFKDKASSIIIALDDEKFNVFSKASNLDDIEFYITVRERNYGGVANGLSKDFKAIIDSR